MLSAMTTFLNRPNQKISTKLAALKLSQSKSCFVCNCGRSASPLRSIGPAISCGKKLLYTAKNRKSLGAAAWCTIDVDGVADALERVKRKTQRQTTLQFGSSKRTPTHRARRRRADIYNTPARRSETVTPANRPESGGGVFRTPDHCTDEIVPAGWSCAIVSVGHAPEIK